MKHCDFCKQEYEGNHLCSCNECDKKHPICNECYDYYIKTGQVKARSSYGDLDRLT